MSIVVSDFDNTILDNNYKENIHAIKEYINRGNMFIIATGRSLLSLKQEIDKYNLNVEYYICNDGAVIYDKYQNVIYRKDIEENIAKEIVKILNNEMSILEVFVENTNGYSKNIVNVNKIIATPYDLNKAHIILSKIKSMYPNVIGYVSEKHININSISTSKGKAIKYLEEFYNFDKNDIYTIGDGINDMDMINNYLGFVLESANDDIKDKSFKTIKSLSELLNRL